MSRVRSRALRLAAILALAAVASFAMDLQPASGSPYASALSSLSVVSAVSAAPSCAFKNCAKEPGRGPNCVKSLSAINCSANGQGCFATAC